MFEPRPRRLVHISAMVLVSLGLACTAGCHRDPNVRKQKYLDSGKKYEADAKYKEASIQFANALRIDKYWAPANFEMGKTMLKTNSISSSYAYLRQAVDLDPNNIEYRVQFGNLALAVRMTPEAEKQANAVLAINPNNPDAYAILAGVAESKNDAAVALKDIQHAIELEPGRSNFHTALALLQARSPDTEPTAEQELTKAASLDAKDPKPHLLLAQLLIRKNDLPGAEQHLIAAIGIAPKDLQARVALASLYMREKDTAKAEQTLLQAVNDLPDEQGASSLLAEFYLRGGQLDHSISVFHDLNAKYPKSLPIKLTYARNLFAKKDYAGSRTLVDQLAKVDAGNPDVQTLNALLLISAGKTADAVTQLKKAVKDYPKNLAPQLLLARVSLSVGDLPTAETSFRAASEIDTGNIEAMTGLADVATRRGDIDTLAGVADKTIQMHPDFAAAYQWRGISEAMRKQYDKADADFQLVLKQNPDNASVYVDLAKLRFAQSHNPEGAALLEKALDKDPNSIVALKLLAGYDISIKQPAKAVARVQAQLAKEPGNSAFISELAVLQYATKDYKGAADSARKAMQMNPANEEAAETFADTEVALGDVNSAISAWQIWTNAHPSDPKSLAILGMLNEDIGNTDMAKDNYKKALQLDPDNGIANNNLAFLMAETGDNLDVALTLARNARRIQPNSPQTADTLAWVDYRRENYIGARVLLEDNLKNFPNDTSLHLHLGMTLEKLGDKPGAQAQLKKAVALEPGSKEGKEASEELDKLGA